MSMSSNAEKFNAYKCEPQYKAKKKTFFSSCFISACHGDQTYKGAICNFDRCYKMVVVAEDREHAGITPSVPCNHITSPANQLNFYS